MNKPFWEEKLEEAQEEIQNNEMICLGRRQDIVDDIGFIIEMIKLAEKATNAINN